jgi:hypothetical protein
MKIVRRFIPLLLILVLAACSLPATSNPTQAPFPIPNKTMTALFSTSLPTLATTKIPSLVTATSPAQPQATATNPPVATATQPPEPTATQAPTATDTPVPTQPAPSATADTTHRTVVSATARKLASKPSIDGDWNDLPDKEYPAEIVVFGKANWTGADDLSASYKIGWDATYLYLGVKVHDDVYAQNTSGANLFKGDSLEIMLDTNVSGDFYSTVTNSDDYQLGISGGNPNVSGTREAYLWVPTSQAGSKSSVTIAALRGDGLTRYEVAIPWSLFGVTPKAGAHYGFVLSVSDNDNTSQNLQQTMVSSDKNRVLTNPTTWGDLTLSN